MPVTNFDEVSHSHAEGGWHFANFDSKREQAPVHQGVAGETDYFLVTTGATNSDSGDYTLAIQGNGTVTRQAPAVAAEPSKLGLAGGVVRLVGRRTHTPEDERWLVRQ